MTTNVGIVSSSFGFIDNMLYQPRQDIISWGGIVASSGLTYSRVQSSGMLSGGMASQASTADADDGDWMEWSVNLAEGVYKLSIIYSKWASYAILDILIDGVSVGTFDLYAAATAHNNVGSITGIVLSEGNHTLRIAANGKNPSSTDYYITPQSITLTRTGA